MNSKMLPFAPAHLDLLELRDVEIEQHKLDPMMDAKLEKLAASGTGGTLVYDGRVVAIIGYWVMWPGVIEVWAFPSKYVKQYATVYLKTAKRYVAELEKNFNPHRLQTTAIADPLHDEWMKFLGFKCDGDLPQYTTNKLDCRLWSKTYDGGQH